MIKDSHEGSSREYVTDTCYVIPDKGILAGSGFPPLMVPQLPWRLLRCLMASPSAAVPYTVISQEVWGADRPARAVLQVLRRLRGFCLNVGAEADVLANTFEIVRNRGLRFNPPSHPIGESVETAIPGKLPAAAVRQKYRDGVYYLTETCCFDRDQCVLVNNGKTSKPLMGLIWEFLNCMMHHPGVKVSYKTIYQAVWKKPHHKPRDVSQLLHRLKRDYFDKIGVDEAEFTAMFTAVAKSGVIFRPIRPVDPNLSGISEAIRNTGIPEDQLLRIVECMLYRGLSGRMGRESIVALAKEKNTMAILELAELTYHGYITRNHKPDYKTACELYEKAGQHPAALWTLGYCIMNNFYPVVDRDEIDYLKARDYFNRAISISMKTAYSAPAYTSLGQLWEEGHYPEDDFAVTHKCKPCDMEQALVYYHKADDLGYHYATNRLGLYYEKEALRLSGNEKKRKEAFDWFQRSVELVPDGYALNKLGQYYETGFGCAISPDKACECYMRGVEEVLEDDITGWNLFNAGRVCALRIRNQPERYSDLPKAFGFFSDALQKLPGGEHGKVLIEMLEILRFGDLSALAPREAERTKSEALYRARRFLEEAEYGQDPSAEQIADRIRTLANDL